MPLFRVCTSSGTPTRPLTRFFVFFARGVPPGLQVEYDDLVAADCVICGEMVIDLIDEPFISVDEQAAFMKSWSIPGQVAD